MKKILLIYLLFIVVSCNFLKDGIEIEISNNSKVPLKNLKFSTSENKEVLTFKELKSGEKINEFLSMKDNKTDGSFSLEFTNQKGEIKKLTAGYYSNGKPLDNKIIFMIQNDTTLIKIN